MEKIKDIVKRIKLFIIDKRTYWYWVAMVLIMIVFANVELLSVCIPNWGTFLINVAILIFATVYSKILIDNLKERIKDKIYSDESQLYSFLETSLKETNNEINKVDESVNRCSDLIHKEIGLTKTEVLADLEAKNKNLSEEIEAIRKYEGEIYEGFVKKIEQIESENNQQIESSTSKILNSVESSENRLNKKLSEQAKLLNTNSEKNKSCIQESKEALLQEVKANREKAEKSAISLNSNLEEIRNNLSESVTKLLETTDISLQEVKKNTVENIVSQTKELVAKLDDVLAENKNNNATINTNFKEVANKLKDMSEIMEGLEHRTASVISDVSASVTKEIKDGLTQSISHANVISEKMIDLVQKNDIAAKEHLDNQGQKILFAIRNRETQSKQNYELMLGILGEIKIALVDIGKELSDIEQGNVDLTEELKKSISDEMQIVSEEFSKIEGNQKTNVLQVIEMIETKLVSLNQELVKHANSILDKSDESNDYVSEKYNRLFDQIQSVAKESKLLINRVNSAIEENKNTIIQSQKDVTNSIDSHFLNIKDKGKEIESLKAVVERNFLSINSELEITRGQLTSLNSLSVLIKNLSEKKDEREDKKQNRVETIEDPESGLTVKNEYKQNKLVMSEMFRGNKKVYEVFYGNKGEILSTKNYDKSGKVSLEMTYHSNGQVKERREFVSGKAEISKYNENGNKIR